ncbi:uncharacterized protein LOC134842226 isoform X2 [Symsagittifera roscoffensis]|uniref:uncharacterized protein LOC134842226 isoform X2 n=1 Tax=Symsagittifera roscoffensis TaxID=84072 RepID=UPI00307C5742
MSLINTCPTLLAAAILMLLYSSQVYAEGNTEYMADDSMDDDITFFCLNCGEGASECCSGVMGLPFCCDENLYAVQKMTWAASEAEKLSTDRHLVTCQSSDQCPTTASEILKIVDENAGGDYCCPLGNICCPFGSYFEEIFLMLSYTFGGPIIFSILLFLLGCAIFTICFCVWCAGSRKNNRGTVLTQGGVATGVVLQPSSTPALGFSSDGMPTYQRLENDQDC